MKKDDFTMCFLISILTYQKTLKEVDKYLDAHKKYLEKFYETGNFIVSGRHPPRAGSIFYVKLLISKILRILFRKTHFLLTKLQYTKL